MMDKKMTHLDYRKSRAHVKRRKGSIFYGKACEIVGKFRYNKGRILFFIFESFFSDRYRETFSYSSILRRRRQVQLLTLVPCYDGVKLQIFS